MYVSSWENNKVVEHMVRGYKDTIGGKNVYLCPPEGCFHNVVMHLLLYLLEKTFPTVFLYFTENKNFLVLFFHNNSIFLWLWLIKT